MNENHIKRGKYGRGNSIHKGKKHFPAKYNVVLFLFSNFTFCLIFTLHYLVFTKQLLENIKCSLSYFEHSLLFYSFNYFYHYFGLINLDFKLFFSISALISLRVQHTSSNMLL